MELHTPRLVLREFQAGDFEAVYAYETRAETHRYEQNIVSAASIRETLEQAQRWAHDNPRIYYRLAVTLCPTRQVIGHVSLILNHPQISEWEIGWTIDPDYWRKGYATEAARAVLDMAFRQLQAHRVVAFCHVLNAASVAVMEKLGMQQEGRLRQVRCWNAGWSDEFVYALLESDWRR
ncbi:MAG: GNAT family protein [Anaerolineae bacterium]